MRIYSEQRWRWKYSCANFKRATLLLSCIIENCSAPAWNNEFSARTYTRAPLFSGRAQRFLRRLDALICAHAVLHAVWLVVATQTHQNRERQTQKMNPATCCVLVCVYNVVQAQVAGHVWSTLCNQKQNTVACIAQKLINPHARRHQIIGAAALTRNELMHKK